MYMYIVYNVHYVQCINVKLWDYKSLYTQYPTSIISNIMIVMSGICLSRCIFIFRSCNCIHYIHDGRGGGGRGERYRQSNPQILGYWIFSCSTHVDRKIKTLWLATCTGLAMWLSYDSQLLFLTLDHNLLVVASLSRAPTTGLFIVYYLASSIFEMGIQIFHNTHRLTLFLLNSVSK